MRTFSKVYGLAGLRIGYAIGDTPVLEAMNRLRTPFNLTGVPALSVPWRQERGMPIGLQVVGRWNDEATVLAVGRQLETLSR